MQKEKKKLGEIKIWSNEMELLWGMIENNYLSSINIFGESISVLIHQYTKPHELTSPITKLV